MQKGLCEPPRCSKGGLSVTRWRELAKVRVSGVNQCFDSDEELSGEQENSVETKFRVY